jgi:hypothetical protein
MIFFFGTPIVNEPKKLVSKLDQKFHQKKNKWKLKVPYEIKNWTTLYNKPSTIIKVVFNIHNYAFQEIKE